MIGLQRTEIKKSEFSLKETYMWCFEILDKDTDEVLLFDKGFISESEAEAYARLDAKAEGLKNYYIRTFPINE